MSALARELDTIVIDIDEPALIGEDSLMQVRSAEGLDISEWHRRALRQDFTACGLALDSKYNMGVRYESYEGRLCRKGCFTPFELALSDDANKPRNP